MGILNKLQIKNKLFLSNDKRVVCGGALSTAAEPSNRLQHSDTEFQRFPQRTLSPISLIMSINIRKRVGSVENLPERSTSLPGASSQCGTLHLNGCTSFCSAIPHHILCFPEEPVRCPFLKIFCPMGQLLVGACGAPNPAAKERDKREVVIVNHFLIFQSMDSALNLLSQHLME